MRPIVITRARSGPGSRWCLAIRPRGAPAAASRDESEFIRRLGDEGIRDRARYTDGGTDVVVGYSVRLPGAADGLRRSMW